MVDSRQEIRAELASAMVRSLTSGMRYGENRVSVFVGYSDEASTGDGNGEFLVCGYLAREEEWPHFARDWQQRVLDPSPTIPYLHMTEIRSKGWRESHGLSREESESKVNEAIKLIEGRADKLHAFGSVILQSDLKRIIHTKYAKGKIPKALWEPDYFCYLIFFYVALSFLQKLDPSVEKVNFFFALKNGVITKHIENLAEDIRAYLEVAQPDLAPLMGEVLPASPSAFLPLQAADTISWHLQRYYGDRRAQREHNATDEQRMYYLLKQQNGFLHEWSREQLEQSALRLDKILEA